MQWANCGVFCQPRQMSWKDSVNGSAHAVSLWLSESFARGRKRRIRSRKREVLKNDVNGIQIETIRRDEKSLEFAQKRPKFAVRADRERIDL